MRHAGEVQPGGLADRRNPEPDRAGDRSPVIQPEAGLGSLRDRLMGDPCRPAIWCGQTEYAELNWTISMTMSVSILRIPGHKASRWKLSTERDIRGRRNRPVAISTRRPLPPDPRRQPILRQGHAARAAQSTGPLSARSSAHARHAHRRTLGTLIGAPSASSWHARRAHVRTLGES